MNQAEFFPQSSPVPPGESDEWYTPPELFRQLHEEFGFTIDVCATRESAKCERFLTQAQDALTYSWAGERVWCNPPYSDLERWVAKLHLEAARAELLVALVPAWTDRGWWHRYVETPRRQGKLEVRFIKGRLRFGWPGNPTGKGQRSSAMFPSVLLVWRRRDA